MKYRILDADGDYSFGKSQQNITYGIYAVAQAIKTRLKLLKGEWWENLEEGTPLFQEILGARGSSDRQMIVDSIVKDRIINTRDVLAIRDFSSEFKNREYTFSCTVTTRYGDIDIGDIDLRL